MPRSSKVKSAAIDDQSEAVEEVLAKSPVAGDVAGLPEVPGVGNINEKIRHLIRQSKEQGYLTFDDINEALPDSVENQDEIDNVLSILQNLDIEIIESEEVESFKQRQEEAEEEEHRQKLRLSGRVTADQSESKALGFLNRRREKEKALLVGHKPQLPEADQLAQWRQSKHWGLMQE